MELDQQSRKWTKIIAFIFFQIGTRIFKVMKKNGGAVFDSRLSLQIFVIDHGTLHCQTDTFMYF